MKKLIVLLSYIVASIGIYAESNYTMKYTVVITDGLGTTSDPKTPEVTATDSAFSAPLTATFTATVLKDGEEFDEVTFNGQWRIWRSGSSTMESPEIVRTENPTEIMFSDGTGSIPYCVAYFGEIYVHGLTKDTLRFDEEYISQQSSSCVFQIKVATSVLTFPNAFSPNGDGHNDIYKAKQVKSIVEFHANIYTRHGQRIYQWDDPYSGWDGTFNGKPVKDGVYYVLVKATGADGTVYEIKKDVNLMRGYTESSTTTN